MIEAYDDQYPQERTSELVTFTVNRNPNSPRFQDAIVELNRQEDTVVGALLVTVLATDDDNVSNHIYLLFQ